MWPKLWISIYKTITSTKMTKNVHWIIKKYFLMINSNVGQFRNRRIYDHNFSKTIRRTFLSPVIFTRVQFYACYVIETCLYWEHHAVMEVSLMSVNFSLKWLPSQEIKLYLFKLIEFMCATFEVHMTNGLIDEMKWGKLNTLSLSQFRVWPLRSNRQLRFDKKDVYGN